MSYVPTSVSSDSVISDALEIASGGTSDIANVLDDIKLDSNLGKNALLLQGTIISVVDGEPYTITAQSTEAAVSYASGLTVQKVGTSFYGHIPGVSDPTPLNYGVVLTNDLNISEASGAMVIDDLMQKISTKVQVAAQMLSASNNIAKTASRILSQG